MALISFDKDTLIDFIPAYAGNRDSDSPCIVRLKFVPYSKVQQYSKLIAARTKGVADNGKITEIAQDMQKKQFMESVEGISSYFIGAKEIIDPAEFYESADSELIIEIIRAMESAQKLSDGQKKT